MIYRRMIAEALATDGRLDRTDGATVKLVEELMRVEHSTLDGLSRQTFVREARAGLAAAEELHRQGDLIMVCDAYGVTVPGWAR